MATPADLGIRIGSLPSGPTGSVLDVPGVGLGHATVVYDDAPPPFGRGIARTGVTVLDLGGDTWESPLPAGVALLNGAGELTARSQIDEWGLLETPVFLTSTMQVGRVYDAACRLLMAEQPRIGVDDVIIPAVGECDDSWLNDPRFMHVTDEHVAAALAAARSSVGSGVAPDEGAVGAGTGMSCFGYKGGIGTASRVLPDGHVLGVVLLTNFGQWDRLTVAGVEVGRALGAPALLAPPPAGSCLGVVVTDAPLDHAACAAVSVWDSPAPGRPRTTHPARSSSVPRWACAPRGGSRARWPR
jgi:D-aminopeptidase